MILLRYSSNLSFPICVEILTVATKKITDAKLAKDFQTVLQEFQKAQRLSAERETAYAPFVPQSSLPSRDPASEADVSSDRSQEQQALLVESKRQPFENNVLLVGSIYAIHVLQSQVVKLFLVRRQEVLLLDNEIAFNEAIIEERDQGIQEIQNQIGEVNEIFKDLAVLVHEQGTMIDDIGSNIENSHAATSQAKSHLAKASKTQRRAFFW
ncbi:putative target SNARE coiled-coil domain, syntaxin domain, syntaxin/epimorphin [Helianthus anomalus]